MQGLGNDFLVFDAPAAEAALDSDRLRALADRHTGVGFDQALMLEPPRDSNSRVFYRVFNSDGTEVEQCGNGARCIAALMYARSPELGRELTMGSAGGSVHARVRDDGLVSVDMGTPNFDPRSLPMLAALRSTHLFASRRRRKDRDRRGLDGQSACRAARPRCENAPVADRA